MGRKYMEVRWSDGVQKSRLVYNEKQEEEKKKTAHKVELAEIQENNSQWDLGKTTISNPFSDCAKSRIHGRHFDTIWKALLYS